LKYFNLQKINMDCITKKLFCAIMLALAGIGGVYPQEATQGGHSPSEITYNKQYTVDEVPNPKTNDANAFVANPDGIISEETVYQLNTMLQNLEAKNKAEIAVVVLNSIGDNDIFDFGVKLFERWGIGKKGSDNGLLILFVLDQRKIRFETGYGLEGILPDAICKRIQMNEMVPYFKEGNYDEGMLRGVKKTVETVENEEFFEDDSESEFPSFVFVVPVAVLLIVIIAMLFKSNNIAHSKKFQYNAERYNAMKTYGSLIIGMIFVGIIIIVITLAVLGVNLVSLFLLGFLLFMDMIPINILKNVFANKLRRQSVRCKNCGALTKLLSETNDNKYLTLEQSFEEKIKSVDYDVFLCENCGRVEINKYNEKPKYSDCPKCGTRSFCLANSYIAIRPTYVSKGLRVNVKRCKYCGFQQEDSVSIPRLTHTSSGGFGGSSFGGGRSGGGSFGGGRSGGGGATSSW